MLIPLLFMGDVVGRLFREFAVTLAVTILISAVVSLTLVPMLCAKLLRHRRARPPSRVRAASERLVRPRCRRLRPGAAWVLEHQRADAGVAVGTLVLTSMLYIVIPKGLFPVQDTGVIQGITEAPRFGLLRGDGASASRPSPRRS